MSKKSWPELSAKDKERALDTIRAGLTRIKSCVAERDRILESAEPRNIGSNNAIYIGDLVEPGLAALEAAVAFLESPRSADIDAVCKVLGCRCGQLDCAIAKIIDLKEDQATLARLEGIESEMVRKDLVIEEMQSALKVISKGLLLEVSKEFAQNTLESVEKLLGVEDVT